MQDEITAGRYSLSWTVVGPGGDTEKPDGGRVSAWYDAPVPRGFPSEREALAWHDAHYRGTRGEGLGLIVEAVAAPGRDGRHRSSLSPAPA